MCADVKLSKTMSCLCVLMRKCMSCVVTGVKFALRSVHKFPGNSFVQTAIICVLGYWSACPITHVVTNCVKFTFWSRPALICALMLKCMSCMVTNCKFHILVQTSHACAATEMHVLGGDWLWISHSGPDQPCMRCYWNACPGWWPTEFHALVQTSHNIYVPWYMWWLTVWSLFTDPYPRRTRGTACSRRWAGRRVAGWARTVLDGRNQWGHFFSLITLSVYQQTEGVN